MKPQTSLSTTFYTCSFYIQHYRRVHLNRIALVDLIMFTKSKRVLCWVELNCLFTNCVSTYNIHTQTRTRTRWFIGPRQNTQAILPLPPIFIPMQKQSWVSVRVLVDARAHDFAQSKPQTLEVCFSEMSNDREHTVLGCWGGLWVGWLNVARGLHKHKLRQRVAKRWGGEGTVLLDHRGHAIVARSVHEITCLL